MHAFISPILFKIASHHAKYRQVELHKKIAAEVEAEGQRLAELMAQQQQQNPQQGYQQQNPQQGYQQQNNYQQQKPQQPQYNAQASNVYQTQQQFQGYNQNAQPIQQQPQARPQQQYLPPGRSNYGKK